MSREVDTAVLTHDRLLAGRVIFDQPAEGYRAAIDPVLMAAAVPVRPGETILDLGSGAGAASLCLAVRIPGCTVIGVERDAALVAIANANALANDLAGRVRFVAGDVRDSLSELDGMTFDHAMANPPYLEPARADLRGPSSSRHREATVESDADLDDWIQALCRSVKRKGRITLIQRADRLADILTALRPRAGDVTILPLWPKAGRAARRVIVSARPGTSAPLRLLNGFVLHNEDGEFSSAADAILNDAAALRL